MIFCRKEKREVHIVISNALKTKSLIVTLFMVSMVTNYVTLFTYICVLEATVCKNECFASMLPHSI